MSRTWMIVLLLTGLALAACSSNQANTEVSQLAPGLEEALPPNLALNVQNYASESLGVPIESIEIKDVEKMDWPNGCLGLPQGDEACVEAITPGWLLTFNVNDQEFRYRVDETGTVIRQEP